MKFPTDETPDRFWRLEPKAHWPLNISGMMNSASMSCVLQNFHIILKIFQPSIGWLCITADFAEVFCARKSIITWLSPRLTRARGQDFDVCWNSWGRIRSATRSFLPVMLHSVAYQEDSGISEELLFVPAYWLSLQPSSRKLSVESIPIQYWIMCKYLHKRRNPPRRCPESKGLHLLVVQYDSRCHINSRFNLIYWFSAYGKPHLFVSLYCS